MTTPLRVLILEDSPTDAEVMVHHLREAGYSPEWRRVETEADFRAHLEPTLDLILADYTLPDFTARQALHLLRERAQDIPVIVVTGTVSEEIALECLRLGASDYLLKDRLARLGEAVRSALAQHTLRRERATAEAAKRESEARARFLADVLERSSQAFCACYPDGRMAIFNSAFCALVGHTEAELRDLDWSRDLTPPEWHAVEAERLAELLRTGRPVRYEKEYHRKDGTRGPVELLVHLVREGEEANPYYFAFVTDLTDRKGAEQALAMRTRQLEAVRAVSDEIARELDLARVLELISRRAADLVGRGAVKVFLWDEPAQCLVQRAWSGGEDPALARLTIRLGEDLAGQVAERRQGMIINDYRAWPFAHSQVLERSNVTAALAEPLLYRGRLVGVILLDNRDTGGPFTENDRELLRLFAAPAAIAIENARLFAELNQSYQNLQQAQDEMVRSEKLRALGQMAAGVAHDLNNMLAVILGQAEMLRILVAHPKVEEELTPLVTAASDCAAIVRRLQDFARQRTRSTLIPIRLDELVREALEITRPRWKDEPQRHGLLIQVQTELADLPPILGNAAEIREALTNLILNAADAMPHGGALTVRGSSEGTWVDLLVTDTGIGMSQEVRGRIFEPFFTTKGGRGTGLGLSVTYAILERHGGGIQVQSSPGHGTTFTLRFQVAPPGVGETPVPTRARPSPRRILLIDDDAAVRTTLARLLRASGHTVSEADGGAAGLAQFSAGPVEVVVTDLGMPEVTGWDVAQAVKRQSPGLPVILLTGWGEETTADSPGASAVDRILGKPVRLNDLLQAIEDLSASAATNREPGAQ